MTGVMWVSVGLRRPSLNRALVPDVDGRTPRGAPTLQRLDDICPGSGVAPQAYAW